MHQYRGKLIVHTGSMFSGKTSSLEKDIKRFDIAGYKTIAFKPALDNRYSGSNIVTHDEKYIEAVLVKNIGEIVKHYQDEKPDVIGIDEAQFLEGNTSNIIGAINTFLDDMTTVIIAGLDIDFTGKPFEILREIMPIADYLYKHHAVCVGCGTDAWISHRKTREKERIIIGAIKEYEPLCRRCFIKEKKKLE